MGSVPPASHEVQLVPSPRHVWHVALQLRHVPRPESVLRKLPSAHVDVHVPALSVNVAPAKHEVQSLDVRPVHVAHVASHASHVLLPLGNLLLGHVATHEPSS